MPKTADEIAIDSYIAEKYPIGSKISFTEKAGTGGSKTLKRHTFKVVGHVNSIEIVSNISMGKTTVGTGDLMGYAVVRPPVFDCDYHMLARLSNSDTKGLDPYSDNYLDKVKKHKKELDRAHDNAPARRLAAVSATYDDQIESGQSKIDDAKEQLASAKSKLDDAAEQLSSGHGKLDSSWKTLEAAAAKLASAPTSLASGKKQLANAQAALASAKAKLNASEAKYKSGLAEYNSKKAVYESSVAEYNQGLASYKSGLATYKEAAGTLASKQSEYEDGLTKFNEKLPDAEKEISKAESKLKDACTERNKVEKPAHAVDSRRETPGSEGYKTYDSVSEIVDSLANIFPYFMYLVAALVASTTMTRMVDEERINSGTLKALGYHDVDIMKKFIVYGAAAGSIGSLLGIVFGHTLLPLIVYNAYGPKFSLPRIVLQFHVGVSLGALALGLAVSVIPAVLSARRSLGEKPAQLLLPKAPASGSKILLERIKPIWSRLNFTQKVTFRNLLRYKKRMLMTVVGVSGAVCLVFCGYAVRNSIDGLSQTQFGDIIRYDLIVAEKSSASAADRAQVEKGLKADTVKECSPIRYESVTKLAGSKGDEQQISLLVPHDEKTFTKYLDIRERKSGKKVALTDDGAIISERLANLVGVKVGDTMTFKDPDDVKRSVRIDGICEMNMNHFMFMSPKAYRSCFGTKASSNAYVMALKDSGIAGTRREAARFMKMGGVLICVQSVALINKINVIVKSLNKIMLVLIMVAVLLAIVIVYNLVTINVAERIRELSTIKVLGFFDNEVSMYIYRETTINSLIAVPVSWLLGWLLQQYVITAVPPENVMFDPACGWLPFVVSAAVVIVVVAIIYVAVNRQLKHVDMLEALKSVG